MRARRRIRGWVAETRATFALALPIMTGTIGQMLMGVADTVMVARVGTVPLAAASLGCALSHVLMVGALGLISGISILTARAYGAGDREAAHGIVRAGLWYSLGLGVLSALLLGATRHQLTRLGQSEEVVREGAGYILFTALSLVPVMVAYAIKQFSEALARPWKPMALFTAGVLLNILLNWVFIYGHWGAPAMGVTGAGLATLIARLVVALALVGLLVGDRFLAPWCVGWWKPRLVGGQASRLIRFGAPVGALNFLEVGAFAFAGLMMGWISAEALGAHQIAITCASTTFTFALGLAMAVGIRVGHAWGRGDFAAVRHIGFNAMSCGALVMGTCGVLFFTLRHTIAGWFGVEAPVAALAAALLVVAAMFQLFDGQQVVSIFALRAMGDVRVPALAAVGAYWLVALPVGYALGFPLGMEAEGIWIGLALGLAVLAVGLGLRFARLTRPQGALTRNPQAESSRAQDA